jgi:hypothetical protein
VGNETFRYALHNFKSRLARHDETEIKAVLANPKSRVLFFFALFQRESRLSAQFKSRFFAVLIGACAYRHGASCN